jgi:proline iminopeptidase
MTGLFPPIEPRATGELELGGRHRMHYELSGRPDGSAVVFLHGGPGSSCNPSHRRFFDPAFYSIVLFDQRGCGQSVPQGEITSNTTQDLVEDLERLRRHLEVERWLVFGGSWGSTLALAYAQAHPERVSGLVLRGLFLASRAEMRWYLEGLRHFLPEAWQPLTEGIAQPTSAKLVAHYGARVQAGDREAARRWAAYESAVMAVGEVPVAATGAAPSTDDNALTARMQVQLHYLVNDCFLGPGALLEGVARIEHLPAILVQGRRDMACPPITAYALKQAWPALQLQMIEEGGHSAMHPAMSAALVQATEYMKTLL